MTQKSQYFSTFWPPIASSRCQALRCGHVVSVISGLFKTIKLVTCPQDRIRSEAQPNRLAGKHCEELWS